jgi:hypothetical protein
MHCKIEMDGHQHLKEPGGQANGLCIALRMYYVQNRMVEGREVTAATRRGVPQPLVVVRDSEHPREWGHDGERASSQRLRVGRLARGTSTWNRHRDMQYAVNRSCAGG